MINISFVNLNIQKVVYSTLMFFSIFCYIITSILISNGDRYFSFILFTFLLFFLRANSFRFILKIHSFNFFFIILLSGTIKAIFYDNLLYTFFPHLIGISVFYISILFFMSKKESDFYNYISLYIKVIYFSFFVFLFYLLSNYNFNWGTFSFQTHYFLFGIPIFLMRFNVKFLFHLALIILTFLFIKKNTTIIIFIFWLVYYSYSSIKNRLFKKFFLFLFLIISTIGILNFESLNSLKYNFISDFSSGNITTRAIMIRAGFEKFLESPFLGNLFSSSPLIDFKSYSGYDLFYSGYVNLHNDFLEILSNGGVFLFLVFMYFNLKPLILINNIKNDYKKNVISTIYFSHLLILFASFFNSVLANPYISSLVFFNLGIVYSAYFQFKRSIDCEKVSI